MWASALDRRLGGAAKAPQRNNRIEILFRGPTVSQATVDRAARLARDFRRQQRDEVAPRAWALGDALGLSPEEVRGYLQSEEQRSMAHVVTQLCGLFRKGTSSVQGPPTTPDHNFTAKAVAAATPCVSGVKFVCSTNTRGLGHCCYSPRCSP
jgi:hypothetical protein